MAVDDVYFAGDPATDSTRRQLERVLKEEPRPRWPWMAALAAGGAGLLFWQARRRRRNNGRQQQDERSGNGNRTRR